MWIWIVLAAVVCFVIAAVTIGGASATGVAFNRLASRISSIN